MKKEFQTYVVSLLQQGTDPQNAFEAAVDEFDIDWNNSKDLDQAELWFEEAAE